ncbi:MAG TPA: ABC transporter permease [Acidobacteriaceae bacterium]|nr:ABC transporter permease [Acidobacteriaceae bacterium]
MHDFRNDLRHALQLFLKNPGFTLAAILALALGIGANTAIFSVVNSVLLKPLSYPNADRMVEFGSRSSLIANFLSSVPEFHVYQQQTSVFQDVAGYDNQGPGFNLTGDRPEQLRGIHVTEGYFRVYGAPIALGRTFTPQEDQPHGPQVVVLSYGLWQRRFGGDPAILGRAISLGNQPYTVVGVIGKNFVADPAADLWIPFQFDVNIHDQNHFFQVAGLLRPGVSLDKATAQLELAAPQYHRDYPDTDPNQHFSITTLQDSITGDVRHSLLILLGAVSLVLLIACANVANLLLVRATARRREFAIRRALGASRARILRQLLTESLLLSLTGGILGLALGYLGVRGLLALAPSGLPRIGDEGSALALDWRILAFTLATALFTGILFGLAPAFTASRTDINSTLKESASRSGTGFRQGKLRSLLIVSEISLALVLLIGGSLLIRTFQALRAVSPGYETHNILTMDMSMTGPVLHTSTGIAQLSKAGRERLNQIPGVQLSATTVWLPSLVGDGLPFHIPGRPADKFDAVARFTSISPGFLELLHIPILRGRDINETDIKGHPSVVLINQALADKFWPEENGVKADPLGQRICVACNFGPSYAGETERTIIGITGDTHNNGLGNPPDPMLILPTAQVPDSYQATYSDTSALVWLVRTNADPTILIPTITDQLRIATHGLPVAHFRTLEEVVGSSTPRESFNMLLLSLFAAVALILAAIGIYAVMAYSVAQRTQEMGIRMALGADRAQIRQLILRQGMLLAVIGVLLGLASAFGLTRLLATFLYGVHPWDPASFLAAPILLTLVALAAVWLPALRASKTNPTEALRTE